MQNKSWTLLWIYLNSVRFCFYFAYRILEEPHDCVSVWRPTGGFGRWSGGRVVTSRAPADLNWSGSSYQISWFLRPDVSNSVRPNTPNVSHINSLHLMRVHYVLLIPSGNLLRLHPRGQSDTYDSDKINGTGTYLLTYLF